MSKVQGHQAALLITALTRKAAAAVSVGTYRRGKLLLRCGVLGGASAPTEGGEGWGISWRPPAYSLLNGASHWPGFLMSFWQIGGCVVPAQYPYSLENTLQWDACSYRWGPWVSPAPGHTPTQSNVTLPSSDPGQVVHTCPAHLKLRPYGAIEILSNFNF